MFVLLKLRSHVSVKTVLDKIYRFNRRYLLRDCESREQVPRKIHSVTGYLVVVSIVMLTVYYIFLSGSSVFDTLVNIADILVERIAHELSPSSSGGPSGGMAILAQKTTSLPYLVLKSLYMVTFAVISVGIYFALFRYTEYPFSLEFLIISVMNYVMCI